MNSSGSPLSESVLNVKKGLREAKLPRFNNLCIIVCPSNFLLVRISQRNPLEYLIFKNTTVYTTLGRSSHTPQQEQGRHTVSTSIL